MATAERLGQKGFRFAAIAGLSAVALVGCGSRGNGASVEKCGIGEGTTIEATFADSKDYEKATDPAVLANFSKNEPNVYVSDPEAASRFSRDYVDVIGEVACTQGEATVLTVAGAQVQQLYLEKTQEN